MPRYARKDNAKRSGAGIRIAKVKYLIPAPVSTGVDFSRNPSFACGYPVKLGMTTGGLGEVEDGERIGQNPIPTKRNGLKSLPTFFADTNQKERRSAFPTFL